MKTVTVLGNFSGRNVGDNAILGNLLADVSKTYPDVLFKIPTFSPGFVKKNFGHYNIETMGLKPWDGALKIFGLSTLRAMLQTDMILITDNILFDRSFFNPLFNYLSTISLFVPLSRRKGIPVIPYNASLGPFTTDRGRAAMQKVLDACPAVIVRDELSIEALEKNRLKFPVIHRGADCAINTPLPSTEKIDAIARKEGLFTNPNGTLSFNINPYIDSWITSGQDAKLGRTAFVRTIAETLDRLITELGVDIMYTTTQTMDYSIVNETLALVKKRDRIKLVGNATYDYIELTGLLSRCGLHVGMRTHSKILAAAAHTPMVTINAYPKSVGFVKTIGMGDWVINLDNLTSEKLVSMISRAWKARETLRQQMIPRVKEEQVKALKAVEIIGGYLYPAHSALDETVVERSAR